VFDERSTPVPCAWSWSVESRVQATQTPMWGHSRFVLGAIGSFLEPFCGHISPKIDKVSEKMTLRYPHEGPCVVTLRVAMGIPNLTACGSPSSLFGTSQDRSQ
jgi:hypothetical protein